MLPEPQRIPIARLGPCRRASPLQLAPLPGQGVGRFLAEEAWVRDSIDVPPRDASRPELLFERAGPMASIYFDPARTRAAVVTCGGLCPGLNNVLRSLYLELHFNYGVSDVLGIRNGYNGLNPACGRPPLPLSLDLVSNIHTKGGTLLGSSRGAQQPEVMVDFLASRGVNLLFCVGGDGTQRGALAISREARRRQLELAVVGIPKTIDNDIAYNDRTFGFLTAVEKASEALHLAHVEAKGAARGVGLVKLMGRDAGFITCMAALVSQEANFVLIPEISFALQGQHGLLPELARRLDARDHAVLVVAEGAGQHLFEDPAAGADASGNRRYHDIGLHLKHEIVSYFKQLSLPVDCKYIDPSYMIRSVPANSDDSLLCDRMARYAVHAGMSGRTELMIGYRHSTLIHVPISLAVAEKRRVDPEGDLWTAVLGATGQPPRFE